MVTVVVSGDCGFSVVVSSPDKSAGFMTVKLLLADKLPAAALIWVFPVASADTTPSSLTEATVSTLDDQVTVSPDITAPCRSFTTARRRNVRPIESVLMESGTIDTLCGAIGTVETVGAVVFGRVGLVGLSFPQVNKAMVTRHTTSGKASFAIRDIG